MYYYDSRNNNKDFSINKEQNTNNNFGKITIKNEENKKENIIHIEKNGGRDDDKIGKISIVKTKRDKEYSILSKTNDPEKLKKLKKKIKIQQK